MAELKLINMKDVEAENVNFLWKPYIALGKITIVQGDPGGGKTTLMLSVASAVTRGTEIFQSGVSEPCDVIFNTAEDGLADTIKPRLEQLGADCSRVNVIDDSDESLSLSDPRIEEAIVKTGAKLCIIDPLQGYLGGSDMHSANGIRPLMKHLAGVAERTDCALVIIGHLNKSGGKSQYRGLGSIDIYAAARSVLTVGKIPEQDELRAVVHVKCNIAAPGVSLAFELDPVAGFKWHGEYPITLDELLSGKMKEDNDSKLGQTMSFIKSELAAGNAAAGEITKHAEEIGIPKMTLDRAKQTLGVKSVRKQNKWFWEL